MKTALTIAGSDCSGGAGIQADLKTFSAHGVFGMSVIVSVVAENTARVLQIQDITPEMILAQMDAVFEDIPPHAVKIGMLSSSICMQAVADGLRRRRPANVVIDPVMYAKNGCPLMDPAAADTLLQQVLPLADVLTPNIPEAERIAGMRITSAGDARQAAAAIQQMGCRAVLVKGGHATGDAEDTLYDGTRFYSFRSERIDTQNTHGTGCTLSSAIAANLARGMDIPTAVERAKQYVTTAIRHALPLGQGCGPTHHFYDLYQKSGLNA